MANYSQSVFFGPKDSLPTSDPLKIIRGTEVDAEFAAISTAVGTKLDTVGEGLSLSGTTAALSLAALTGTVTPVAGDKLVVGDISDSDATKYITIQQILDLITYPDTSITAGLGFDGDGSASTLVHDWSEFPEDTGSQISTDFFMMYDAGTGTERRVSAAGITKIGRDVASSTYTVLSDDTNRIIWWNNAGGTVTLNTSSGKDDCEITIVARQSGALTIAVPGGMTINGGLSGADKTFSTFNRGDAIVLRRFDSTNWYASRQPSS